jgi:hypothetical protein
MLNIPRYPWKNTHLPVGKYLNMQTKIHTYEYKNTVIWRVKYNFSP